MNEKLIVTLNVDDLKNIIDECVANAISKNQMPKEEDTLIKRKDVAELFGISYVTLNEWMHQGKIPYYRINSRIFFKKKEVFESLTTIKMRGKNNPK